MIENITKWNYKTDFSVVFRFNGGIRPNYPWQMAFITDSEHSHTSKIFVAGFDGTKYTNCSFIDCTQDSVRIEFKDHKLAPGRLRYEFQREVPNDLFIDGKQRLFDPQKTHIELYRGPSDDCETPPEVTIITERISRGKSAYELYLLSHPESTLNEEEYSSYPIIAGDVANSAATTATEAAALANESAQIIETIEGANVVIDVVGGRTYICGELTSLNVKTVVDSPRDSFIRFRSGAVATTLALPSNLKVVGYAMPAQNMTYEIAIANRVAYIIWV